MRVPSHARNRSTAGSSSSANATYPSAIIHLMITIRRRPLVYRDDGDKRLRPRGGSFTIDHRNCFAALSRRLCCGSVRRDPPASLTFQFKRFSKERRPGTAISSCQRSSPKQLRRETGAEAQASVDGACWHSRIESLLLIRSPARVRLSRAVPWLPHAWRRESVATHRVRGSRALAHRQAASGPALTWLLHRSARRACGGAAPACPPRAGSRRWDR